jgi:hypothetical protein
MPDLKKILEKLHCSLLWLDYDLLDSEFWLKQYSKYQTSDDKHTEHYRFAAFQAVLNNRESLDQTTIVRYIELAIADSDQLMTGTALALLIEWTGLTDTQLQQLSSHPAYNKPFLQKVTQRVLLVRELHLAGITDESFGRFLDSQDEAVHRTLLSISDIRPDHLRLLIDQGANKAIRNMAKRRLTSF